MVKTTPSANFGKLIVRFVGRLKFRALQVHVDDIKRIHRIGEISLFVFSVARLFV